MCGQKLRQFVLEMPVRSRSDAVCAIVVGGFFHPYTLPVAHFNGDSNSLGSYVSDVWKKPGANFRGSSDTNRAIRQ